MTVTAWYVKLPCSFQALCHALFDPALEAESLMSVSSLTYRPHLVCTVTNLSHLPNIIGVGTLSGTAQAVALPGPRISTLGQGAASSFLPALPEALAPSERASLQALLSEFQDVFSQAEDDIGQTQLAEHTIHTQGPPYRVPYCR